jgi:uncharacterized repeat protein (TIGR01451 family)
MQYQLVSIRNKGKRTLKSLVFGFVLLSATCLPTQVSLAAGTAAGTPITNQATANYTVGGTNYTQISNTTTTSVAEILNVDVVWQDAGNVAVSPGDTLQVLTFQVTNTGNGTDDYTLAGLSALGGDDFDPTLLGIYLDSNGNGSYDSGTDVQYVSGTNDPALPADTAVTVFFLNNIPGSLSEGDLGNSQITVTSKTGSGAPGTTVSNAGENGTDAVVGTSGGIDADTGSYVVSALAVSVVKSVGIADPFGGSEPVPGAVLTYTLTVGVVGAGRAQGLVITDPIPADTTYIAGTLNLNTGPLTDAADADAGDVGATTPGVVTVDLGDLTNASGIQTITFDVTIN